MKYIFLILLFFLQTPPLWSQHRTVSITLPTVALLDIHPSGSINLKFSAPTEAGNPLVNPSNNTKWLNYTSAVTAGTSRTVTAQLNQTIPGVAIRVQAAAASGSGGGIRGVSAGLVTIGTSPSIILSGIGGAFTGNDVNNGHQLTISLAPGNYANLSAQTNSVVITYTLSDI
ncbi:MAG TPA: hypothetical protein PK191_05910 [Niabella sp.]|nr:hypothetical protein [Niabella sp.]HOZ96305.1 hypothetical protein [Niabella sp.]HQW14621.1 hypothetical protein [Niabella sp.]HQX19760.1 hypothetical protein [Niabella sp.]HQX42751.1 hypothetical protein [Niabella sp.]